eukprot:TRINITY_DN9725_c0_g1_i1.p1 TRINITY_DN9725_c0_g1~~TRINITY_DN9725_c0_g1_i1.p1  ORF type:complete len:234 (+),score=50.87 TRINITY_DN9725_c0_g1_i1:1-702(+)
MNIIEAISLIMIDPHISTHDKRKNNALTVIYSTVTTSKDEELEFCLNECEKHSIIKSVIMLIHDGDNEVVEYCLEFFLYLVKKKESTLLEIFDEDKSFIQDIETKSTEKKMKQVDDGMWKKILDLTYRGLTSKLSKEKFVENYQHHRHVIQMCVFTLQLPNEKLTVPLIQHVTKILYASTTHQQFIFFIGKMDILKLIENIIDKQQDLNLDLKTVGPLKKLSKHIETVCSNKK